jgi:microcystin-dependent protein
VPIETFGSIDALNSSNPIPSEGLVGGDDHIRGIKATLKTTFPNVTGAVTGTQAQLNAAAAWTDDGVNKLDSTGAMFDANATDGFKNLLAGDIDVVLQGNTAFEFTRAGGVNTAKNHGKFVSDGEISGPGITPIGAAVMWFDDTLPTDGLWVWANGQIISSANTVAPILLARWGTRFGGNGLTTMGVPNMQEVVPVGKSGMGGATAPGLLTSIAAGVKDVLLTLFGVDVVTLTSAQVPTHDHAVYLKDPQHTHGGNAQTGGVPSGSSGVAAGGIQNASIAPASTGITIGSVSGVANDNKTASSGGGGSHTNLQPSKAVNWIIRLG